MGVGSDNVDVSVVVYDSVGVSVTVYDSAGTTGVVDVSVSVSFNVLVRDLNIIGLADC